MVEFDKTERLLGIFYRALKGEDIVVSKLSNEYGVSKKTISRDINDLKAFFADQRDLVGNTELEYSYQSRCYRLYMDEFLLSKELFAMVKILIGSRALNNEDMHKVISKLKSFTVAGDRKMLDKLLQNELYHYNQIYFDSKEPLDDLWRIINAIDSKKEITISYYKMNRKEITRRILPAAVMFSEYYFYLIAFHDEEGCLKERFYRADRIKSMTVHRDRTMNDAVYNEGELRKFNQFMMPGKKKRVKFCFTGPSVRAVLDKLPTARIVESNGRESIIEAEVYGDGIKMFLLSQGSNVRVLEPESFACEMKEELRKMCELYSK